MNNTTSTAVPKSSRRSSGHRQLLLAGMAFAGVALSLSAAHAQSTKIFVASFGNDANDGSRGSPKRNFQAAHNAVAADGQIVVLDTAGYGALTITKGVSVTVPPGVNGFVSVTGATSGITVAAAGNDVISLRGLVIEASGPFTSNRNGIVATSFGSLTIEDCSLRNFEGGIRLTAANNAQVFVHNTAVRSCAFGFFPATSGTAAVTSILSGCRLEGNSVAVFNQPGSGTADVTVTDCTIAGNSVGINSNGAGAVTRVSNCTITGSNLGVFAANGGQVRSRGNNTLEKNTDGNVFSAAFSAK